jgi:hypothetical protein
MPSKVSDCPDLFSNHEEADTRKCFWHGFLSYSKKMRMWCRNLLKHALQAISFIRSTCSQSFPSDLHLDEVRHSATTWKIRLRFWLGRPKRIVTRLLCWLISIQITQIKRQLDARIICSFHHHYLHLQFESTGGNMHQSLDTDIAQCRSEN